MARTRRPAVAFVGVVALALGTAMAASAPAHAAVATITCTGWTYTTYTPGLTDTVRPTTVVDQGRLNVIGPHSPTGSCLAVGSSATSGTRDVTALLNLSCDAVLTESGVETIVWNDGQSTSFTFTATAAHVGSNTVLTETGDVTTGEFTGDHVVETFTAPNLSFLDCATATGVTSLDYATVITIAPL
ncbi:MAG TPA: hypothetical protein VL551_17080 [Actinospica sp.]|jgi:hypothetical protein|nr:hypothetical protein [Actinospica sp.]